jgi:hypothetical protein
VQPLDELLGVERTLQQVSMGGSHTVSLRNRHSKILLTPGKDAEIGVSQNTLQRERTFLPTPLRSAAGECRAAKRLTRSCGRARS